MRMLRIALVGCAALLAGCGGPNGSRGAPYTFSGWGTMREALREGKTEGRVSVVRARRGASEAGEVVGLGAAEGLAGEIAMLGGEAWVTSVGQDGDLRTLPADEDLRATLLMAAGVRRWRTALLTGEELDEAVEAAVGVAGHGGGAPVPFVVEGVAERLEGHVINGACPIADPDAAAAAGSVPGRARHEGERVVLVGFYDAGRPGVYTHHTGPTHVHTVRVGGVPRVLHVEEVRLRAGAVLRVPG